MSTSLPLFSPDFEADELPFGPAKNPALLLDVANSIRAYGGEVWNFDKLADRSGVLFRANIGHHQFRVFVPMPGRDPQPTAPTEKGSLCHRVTTLQNLEIWLKNLQYGC